MTVVLTVLLSTACRPPPPAPEDLDAVAAYLYANHMDDDAAEQGLVNLRAWFESDFDADADRGFALAVALTQEDVDSIDVSAAWSHPDTKLPRLADGMLGAAAGTEGTHPIDDYVAALTAVDQDVVFPDTFAEWGRTWRLCDGDAFAQRECFEAEADEQQDSRFGFGFNSQGESYNQYRWVELSDGQWAMTHRNWQIYPPNVSREIMEVQDQYYLNTFVPSSDGSVVYRFQATWAIFGDNVPEDAGLNLTASSMFDSSQELDAWLDDNDP